MAYNEISNLAQKKIDAITYAVATMDRSLVRAGLKFGKEVGKEYAKALAFKDDVSDTFSSHRKEAIWEASIWLASKCSEEFMEIGFERVVNAAMDPILRNPSFRKPDEMDQISTYVAQAVMSILLEDSGFLEENEQWVVKTLRKPWTSVFGSSAFLIRP
jgi:hypothetical protein